MSELEARGPKESAHLNYRLADHLAVKQGTEGGGGLLHRETMGDVRAHDAECGEPRQLLGIVATEFGREAPDGLARAHAQDRQALDQHMVRHDPARIA